VLGYLSVKACFLFVEWILMLYFRRRVCSKQTPTSSHHHRGRQIRYVACPANAEALTKNACILIVFINKKQFPRSNTWHFVRLFMRRIYEIFQISVHGADFHFLLLSRMVAGDPPEFWLQQTYVYPFLTFRNENPHLMQSCITWSQESSSFINRVQEIWIVMYWQSIKY